MPWITKDEAVNCEKGGFEKPALLKCVALNSALNESSSARPQTPDRVSQRITITGKKQLIHASECLGSDYTVSGQIVVCLELYYRAVGFLAKYSIPQSRAVLGRDRQIITQSQQHYLQAANGIARLTNLQWHMTGRRFQKPLIGGKNQGSKHKRMVNRR
jgi:hypothetical protein